MRLTDIAVRRLLITITLGMGLTALASGTALSSHPVVVAIRHGDCAAAVKLLNADVLLNDDQTAFLTGRMLDEGICVQKNSAAAGQFFARAMDLGDKNAELDYGAKVGLGDGTQQSYERAGDLCRDAGLDPEARLSRYSLGYACTLRSVAGELLRETLPKGAFSGGTAAVLVEFSPASAQMHIRSTPHVRLGEAPTGTNMRLPLIDAQGEIEKAWRNAVAAVPKPDAAQLDNQTVQLSLDVDMTIEAGKDVLRNGAQPFRSLAPGDFMPRAELTGAEGTH
jgi:hypothetical protein